MSEKVLINENNPTYVEAIDGKKYDKKLCRRIKGVYYLIGDINKKDSGHCYKINNKYYKYNTGYIVFDHRLNQYVIKNTMFIIEKGVVAIVDGKPEFGSFSKPEGYLPVFLSYKGVLYHCLSEDILKNCFEFKESLEDGIYYERTSIKSIKFIKPKIIDSSYKNSLSYDCKDSLKYYVVRYNKYSINTQIDEIIERYGFFIDKYTFGLEFETTAGIIPERISFKNGLIPVRDGSIKGLEYVTVPLSGKKGLQNVKNSIQELKKRTEYNSNCSLHLHIGNVPRTEKFILALYKVLCILQDEMYEMFPLYKRENYGVKRKCYTRPFPIKSTLMLMDNKINSENIKDNFTILFNYLSMNYNYSNYDNDLSNVLNHPSDPHGTSKWNIRTRYHAYNLIPLLFGNKETVEFRLHTPTFELNKIFNYMVICTSIIKYAEIFQDDILNDFKYIHNLTLNRVLSEVIQDNNLYLEINRYIDKRKRYIYSSISKGNIICPEDEFFYSPSYVDWEKFNSKSVFIKNHFINELHQEIINDLGNGPF